MVKPTIAYEDLKRAFADAVDKDKATLRMVLSNLTIPLNLKEKIFKKLLQQTDSFKTSIFKIIEFLSSAEQVRVFLEGKMNRGGQSV